MQKNTSYLSLKTENRSLSLLRPFYSTSLNCAANAQSPTKADDRVSGRFLP